MASCHGEATDPQPAPRPLVRKGGERVGFGLHVRGGVGGGGRNPPADPIGLFRLHLLGEAAGEAGGFAARSTPAYHILGVF